MDAGTKWAVAADVAWFVIVLAVSFVGVPLMVRAPGIGLGVVRLVVRACNVLEYLFAMIIAAALFVHETSVALNIALCLAVGVLLTQTVVMRSLVSRRTAAILDGGDDAGGPGAHYAYVGLEAVKLAALVWTAVLLIGE